MVFIKNPVAGKVKTRLAATLGDSAALAIYRKLLGHTLQITRPLPCVKVACFSHFIPGDDEWRSSGFKAGLQQGADLGERMYNAFAGNIDKTCRHAVLIGSDCFELNTDIIEQAFTALRNHDVVIGPAADGGYYLLGMKRPHPALFQHKQWSTDTVLKDTLQDCSALHLSWFLLPELSDIDEEKDLIGYDQRNHSRI